MTTIKDVARLAGVSFKTVSRVLNEHPSVADSTRQRVLDAIEELNYRPSPIARGLRTQRTHTIGFVSDEIGTTPFAGAILHGAQDLAWQHNTLLYSINTGRNSALKRAAVESLLDRHVDGIIYAATYHRVVSPPHNLYDVPAVLLDCFVEDRSLPSVVPDEEQGGYDATRHLLENGYRRIGFLNHGVEAPVKPEPEPAARGHFAGYRRALQEHDIPFNPELVVADNSFIEGGYRAARRLLSIERRPEAIFCFNDRMALGAYQAMSELGLKIPDDVAIVGFDNQPYFGEAFRPPLTTLELPHYAMGQWAVQYLIDRINDDAAEPEATAAAVQHTIGCRLIMRDSSGSRHG